MSTESNTSNRVYVKDEEYGWVPAKVVTSDSKVATVSILKYKDENSVQSELRREPASKAAAPKHKVAHPAFTSPPESLSREVQVQLKEYPACSLPLQNVDADGKLHEVDDMVDLPFLHEPAILFNLKARHIRCLPYTRTGDIIIAVNPYQWITGLYSDDMRDHYAEKLVWEAALDADPKSSVSPHVYEVSSLAYRGLAVDARNQSILVSGESGAGKTETVKILINHLAAVQSTDTSASLPEEPQPLARAESFRTSPIVDRVLDSNPLLEAFGNAKTVRNDNSSRFGKYIQLQFDTEDPTLAAYAGKTVPSAVLAGSKCEVYLLEKSRVVSHEEEERTYHIFYQLLAAPQEYKEKLWPEGLGGEDVGMDSFAYVGYTDCQVIEKKSDAEHWHCTVKSLGMVGIKKEKLDTLMRAVCVVLQLGNLVFEPDPSNDENSIVANEEELLKLAHLMGMDKDPGVVRKALTLRTVSARNEVYHVPLNATKAKDSCDAFAKEIYASIFLWLVRTINDATCAEKNYRGPVPDEFGTIGLLDIFGFESFVINRFEQLCINYANEKLQQKFTMDIFRSVQAEYEYEGIELGEVAYRDNADVLNLIEGRMGLLAVLNEECVRPKGNDTSFVAKIRSVNRDAECLIQDKFYTDAEFGISHYAGPVTYNAINFVTKNMDTLPPDLVECAKQCSNDVIRKELGAAAAAAAAASSGGGGGSAGGGGRRGGPPGGARKGGSLVSQTVATKFRLQLSSLMKNIGETRTRYIRCVKPNKQKKPQVMEHASTIEQLRCAGVVAAVTISRSAFPNRLDHETAVDRFSTLSKSKFKRTELQQDEGDAERVKADVERLMDSVLKSLETTKNGKRTKAFVVGKTRVYFRAGSLEFLEDLRLKSFGQRAVQIQKVVRGFVQRCLFCRVRRCAVVAQARARAVLFRRRFCQMRAAAILCQCAMRCTMARVELQQRRCDYCATKLQTSWRMLVARRFLQRHLAAVILMQAQARGARQRPIFRKELAEKAEETKLENQLKTLQRKLIEAEERRAEAEKRAQEQAQKTVVVYRDAAAEEKKEAPAAAPAPAAPTPAAAPAPAPPPPPSSNTPSVATTGGGPLTAQQQMLMDESGKMLEYLRKEVFKLRSANAQLRTDFELLKENNQRLMDANASAGASFAALNQHAKQLNKTNAKLMAEIANYKQQLHKAHVISVESREELKMKQATYIAEVHSRLQYQKTLAAICDAVQDRCRDDALVEDVLAMSDDVESNYMMAAGEQSLQQEQEQRSSLSTPRRAPSHNTTQNSANSSNSGGGGGGGLTARISSFFYGYSSHGGGDDGDEGGW